MAIHHHVCEQVGPFRGKPRRGPVVSRSNDTLWSSAYFYVSGVFWQRFLCGGSPLQHVCCVFFGGGPVDASSKTEGF